MIKLSFCLRRKAELTLAEFQDYWRHNHAPLVRKHQAVLRIHRYVQVHRLEHGLNDGLGGQRGAPEPFDGIAELWFNSIDDILANAGSEAARAAGRELLEDEARFIDLANSPLWIGEEHEIITPRGVAVY